MWNKERFRLNLRIAVEALLANKFRSLLTALGIIFGVAAVIAMLAIGNGARQEVLEQIKLVGVNNIVITPVTEQEEQQDKDEKKTEQKRFSPGLSLSDIKGITEGLPGVAAVSPEIEIDIQMLASGKAGKGKLIGVTPAFFDITRLPLSRGKMFNAAHLQQGSQVCIIGAELAQRMFSDRDALGSFLKCGNTWLQVIGILEARSITKNAQENLGIRNYNQDVYTPIRTMMGRYKNRNLVTKSMLESSAQDPDEQKQSTPENKESYHQLDRLVVQMKDNSPMNAASVFIDRMLTRRHNGQKDFKVSIPEILVKQQQRTKDIFNIVLGAIAGISLLVGGIGIMNIMLASVLERTKEIGIRQSMGATRQDIVQQFLFESTLISLGGGLAGIILGLTLSVLITKLAGIATIISPWSIIISFAVSAMTGLIFGITPAKNAAAQDPIKSLRYE
jgi:putative ABC transport system permease protein